MRVLFAAILLCSFAAFADEPADAIRRGISLYDAGKYDEAIAVFHGVLANDPQNELAAYELALTLEAKGDYAQCRSVIEPRAKKKGRYQGMMYALLGNCLDMSGEGKRAIDAYRKGLRVAPDDPHLLYNLSVALVGQGKLDEARKMLKKEVTLSPLHGSGQLVLAQVFAAQNFRSAAAVQYLRFLAVEPSGPRAREAAGTMLRLLNAGVDRKDEKNVTITIDSEARKEEGDYATLEMMLAIAGAAATLPEKASLTDFERTRQQVASTLKMLVEIAPSGRDHTARVNVPFFAKLHEQKMLDTVAGLAISSLDLPGTAAWEEANAAAIQSYATWIDAQRRR